MNNRTIDHAQRPALQTTVVIEDALYQQALELADPAMDRSELFREALKTFVRVRVGKRLAAMGGTLPEIRDVPRRRMGLESN